MVHDPIDLGYHHTVIFSRWAPDRDLNPQYAGLPDVDPWGLVVDHLKPDGTPCAGGCITFDTEVARQLYPGRARWTLESLEPLTVSPSLLCSCGDHGFIRGGRWVPA